MKSKIRFLIFLSTLLIALGICVYGTAAANVTNLEVVDLSVNFAGAGATPHNMAGSSDVLASHFSIAGDATKVGVRCPSWSDDVGFLTVKLYKYDTSYQKSVSLDPIASHDFDGFADNAFIGFSFDASAPLKAGEYIITVSDAYDEGGGGVGLYLSGEYPGQRLYQNGKEFEKKSFLMHVEFVTAPAGNPYGTLSDNVDESVIIDPIPNLEYMIRFSDPDALEEYMSASGNNSLVSSEVIDGILKLTFSGNDPIVCLTIPDWLYDNPLMCKDAGSVLIKIRFPGGAPSGQAYGFYMTETEPSPNGNTVVNLTTYQDTTDWQYVYLNFENSAQYDTEDNLKGIRLDIFEDASNGEVTCEIEYILFFKNYQSAKKWDGNFDALPTPAPSPVPTATPEVTATPEATQTPPATQEPQATQAPSEDDKDSGEGKGNTGLIIGIVIAIVAVIAVVVVVLIKKKK